MSYIRYGHDLCWFDDKSDLYVYNNGNGIEDYGGSRTHNDFVKYCNMISDKF